jgi:chemotaxis protein CheD
MTLKPAELFISERPTIVRTVLGSCVAVTMFDRRLKISAICHALLPKHDGIEHDETRSNTNYKYVDTVIPLMVKRLRTYGSELPDLEVKLFGGADMLSVKTGQPNLRSVGRLNIEAVFQILKAHHLSVKVSDVGGTVGRKILFYTHTGEVLLKRIKPEAVKNFTNQFLVDER